MSLGRVGQHNGGGGRGRAALERPTACCKTAIRGAGGVALRSGLTARHSESGLQVPAWSCWWMGPGVERPWAARGDAAGEEGGCGSRHVGSLFQSAPVAHPTVPLHTPTLCICAVAAVAAPLPVPGLLHPATVSTSNTSCLYSRPLCFPSVSPPPAAGPLPIPGLLQQDHEAGGVRQAEERGVHSSVEPRRYLAAGGE